MISFYEQKAVLWMTTKLLPWEGFERVEFLLRVCIEQFVRGCRLHSSDKSCMLSDDKATAAVIWKRQQIGKKL